PEPMKLAAQLSHYALYVLMIGMPLIGWGMLSAAAYPVVLFGGVYLPAILPQSDSLHTLLWNAHFYFAFVFFALVLLHVAAALRSARAPPGGPARGPELRSRAVCESTRGSDISA
ncbi:MAG TPA: cytochrome b/b6 domain-containing protein, partial [Acetobacteraceae bacterium]|nr:cytochrome b/b6 domain-containing protein [Acetobacteraceae bacterium]